MSGLCGLFFCNYLLIFFDLRDVMCGSLICTNTTSVFPVLEGANSRFTDNFYSQDSKVECVRTMFSVGYGNPNPAFVTDGTKCGQDKVSGLISIFF